MGKRVLVIGAGIAGLSAASYLQRNGFDTEIFESHTAPGGLCTAWKRQGYTFDGCIHWLMGSGPSSNLHEIWKELGAADLQYIEWDLYSSVRLSDGDNFRLYTDPSRLEAEMLRLSPEDGQTARALARQIRRVMRIDMPAAMDKMSFGERFALLCRLPAALPLLRWFKRPVSEFLAPLRGEKLREGFRGLFGESMEDFPAGALFMMLGFMAKQSSGYPLGGSLAFARSIEAKYLSLGGKLHYGSRVDEIMVENGVAVGLRGAWGEARGDYVISAADAQDCLERMLGGKYPHPGLTPSLRAPLPSGEPQLLRRGTEEGRLVPFPSLIYLGLGLKGDWRSVPHMQTFVLPEPLILEDGALTVRRISVRLFSFDPGTAPAGKTAATVMIETYNDGYWMELHEKDSAAYEAKKAETARAVIAALDAFLPGLAASVEVVDVATPRSFIRYTNNRHGSFEGWLPTGSSFGKKIAATLPGLDHFYMIGQWLNPGGGLPPCGIEGRKLAKRLCSMEGIRFRPE